MEPFATAEQYEARYGDVDDADVLAEILMDATREIAAALEQAGIDYSEPTEEFAARLMQVCRSMANRAVGDDTDVPLGATQYSQGAGEYTQSFSISNPFGDLFISKAERKLLGLGRARASFCVPGES